MNTARRKTPFKDKDGFYIYEGDLCRSYFEDPEGVESYWRLERVVWKKGEWCLEDANLKDPGKDETIHLLRDWYHELEVVGE